MSLLSKTVSETETKNPAESEIRAAVERSFHAILPRLILMISVFFAALCFADPFLFPREYWWLFVLNDLGMTGFLLSGYLILRLWPLSVKWAHPISCLYALLAVLNCVPGLILVNQPTHVLDFAMVILACACVLLSRRYFLIVVAFAFFVLLVLGRERISTEEGQYFFFVFAIVCGLSWLVLSLRLSTHAQEARQRLILEATQRRLMEKTRQLEISTEDLRKEAEDRRHFESLLQQYVSNAPAPIAMFDRGMNYVLYSRRWMDAFHLTAEDMNKPTRFEMFPQLRMRWEYIKNSCLSGAMEQGEEEEGFLTSAGEVEWLRWEAQPWYLPNQEVGGIMMFVEFITERKNAEKALQESEERLQDLFDNANDMIFSASIDGSLMYVNRAWLNKLGYSESEIAGMTVFEAIDPDYREAFFLAYQRLLEGEAIDNLDTVFVSKNGARIQAAGNVNCRFEDGVAVVARNIFRDVTESKRAETALIRAKEEAELANLTKSRFLATMSHELRTPLNSIIGFSKLLLKNKYDNLIDQDLDYITRILGSGLHLLSLINDLLDLSKIEAGRMELDMKEIPLEPMLKTLASQFEGQVRQKNIDLEIDTPEGLEPLCTDSAKLFQVLMNLVSNAVKFTEEGGVIVRVSTAEGLRQAARIDVIDSGIGIAPDRLNVIFESFQQADNTTARKYGGTGLGLAISRSLCQLMGYDLVVDSRLGEGSVFSILIQRHAKLREPITLLEQSNRIG
ncbi:MAG: PAS domain S-box protein [bacterium]|nr:PAS domain S-box protein [bacterium]